MLSTFAELPLLCSLNCFHLKSTSISVSCLRDGFNLDNLVVLTLKPVLLVIEELGELGELGADKS